MKTEVNVLLLGFAPFEKSTFEAFFRLVGKRETLYKIVPDLTNAQVLMINGASAEAVQWANASIQPNQKALYIGQSDASAKWPTASRPIKLTAVLGLLDILVVANKAQIATEAPAAKAPPVGSTVSFPVPTSNFVLTQPSTFTSSERQDASVAATKPGFTSPAVAPYPPVVEKQGRVAQGTRRKNSSMGMSSFLGLSAAPVPAASAQNYDDILVVDDSDVALKFMQSRLTRYGFRAELARSGEEALTLVSVQNYKFVFLDVMMEGLDGYQTCRAIKQRKYPSGKAPVVVMLTSRGGSIDKIRGGLAGCDAYLTKPLNEAEMLKVLSKYDEQVERSFRDTGLSGSYASKARNT